MLAWLSAGARCKWLAYGSANATATPSLRQQNPVRCILLVPADPSCPGKKAIKRVLMLLLLYNTISPTISTAVYLQILPAKYHSIQMCKSSLCRSTLWWCSYINNVSTTKTVSKWNSKLQTANTNILRYSVLALCHRVSEYCCLVWAHPAQLLTFCITALHTLLQPIIIILSQHISIPS